MYLDGLLKKKVIPKKSRVKLEVGMTVLDQNTVKCNKKSPTPMTISKNLKRITFLKKWYWCIFFVHYNELENKDRSFILQMDECTFCTILSQMYYVLVAASHVLYSKSTMKNTDCEGPLSHLRYIPVSGSHSYFIPLGTFYWNDYM